VTRNGNSYSTSSRVDPSEPFCSAVASPTSYGDCFMEPSISDHEMSLPQRLAFYVGGATLVVLALWGLIALAAVSESGCHP